MIRIMVMNGLLISLILIWTSAAKEPSAGYLIKSSTKPPTGPLNYSVSKPMVSLHETNKEILRRKFLCGSELGGVCVNKKKSCPSNLPSEKSPGKPYCSKKKDRCCYPDPTTAAPPTVVPTTTTTSEDVNWSDIRNACIKSNNYKTYQPLALDICKEKCVEEDAINCQSIEYSSTQQMCAISEARSDSDDFIAPCFVDGWVFAEIELNAGSSCGFQTKLSSSTFSNHSSKFAERTGVCSLMWKGTGHRPLILIKNKIVPPVTESVSLLTTMKITCPGSYLIQTGPDLPSVYAQCQGGGLKICPKQFPKGTLYKIEDFRCNDKVKSSIIPKADASVCSEKLYQIGFDNSPLDPPFHPLIDICFDETLKTTIWTKHTLHGKSIKQRFSMKNKPSFNGSGFLDTNMHSIYAVESQYLLFEMELERKDIICNNGYLAKGHMAPRSDFMTEAEQDATFYFLNVFPQWEVINGQDGNWALIERRIQDLATDLKIFSGGIGVLELQHTDTNPVGIYLGHQYEYNEESYKMDALLSNTVPVPQTTWKIVLDESKTVKRGLAFVVINNPNVCPLEGAPLCKNVCEDKDSDIKWLDSPTINAYDRFALPEFGLTHCCTISDFMDSYPEVGKIIHHPFIETLKTADPTTKARITNTTEDRGLPKLTCMQKGGQCQVKCVVGTVFKGVMCPTNRICCVPPKVIDCKVEQGLGEHPPLVIDITDDKNRHILYTKSVKHGHDVIFACPGEDEEEPTILNTFKRKGCNGPVIVKCRNGKLKPAMRDVSDIGCKWAVEISVKEAPKSSECKGKDLKKWQIGYIINHDKMKFLPLISLCFNKNLKTTLWTTHTLQGEYYNPYKIKSYTRPSNFDAFQFQELSMSHVYDKVSQYQIFLNKLEREDIVCNGGNMNVYLARGHMSPSGDFITEDERDSTFYYMNTLPQWQSINDQGGNWGAIERRIQALAIHRNSYLKIYSGGYQVLFMNKLQESPEDPDAAIDPPKDPEEITLGNIYEYSNPDPDDEIKDREKKVPVPAFTWKIVIDETKSEGIAFVVRNDPFFDVNKAENDQSNKFYSTNICSADHCSKIEWLQTPTVGFDRFKKAKHGYTYCCKISELMKANTEINTGLNLADVENMSLMEKWT